MDATSSKELNLKTFTTTFDLIFLAQLMKKKMGCSPKKGRFA